MAKSIEHNIFPNLAPRAELYEKVGYIEKSWLNDSALQFPAHVINSLQQFNCFRITGVQALFEEQTDHLKAASLQPAFFSGLYNLNVPLLYIIQCCKHHINIFMGTNSSGTPALTALLESYIGSSLYSPCPVSHNVLQQSSFCAAVTGIPTPTFTEKKDKPFSILDSAADAFISGLSRGEWLFVVQAFPIHRQQTNIWIESCSREIKDIKEGFLLRDIQKANRMAAYYIEILEKSIKRLNIGIQQGLWQTGVYIFSNKQETVLQGAALLASLYSGSKSTPEPLRTHVCSRNAGIDPFINCCHSKELCSFISLPSREFSGFRLLEQPLFDVDFTPEHNNPLNIGLIKSGITISDQTCSIPVNDLTRHALIAGVTGSGKTNTVFNLLQQLYNSYQIPFLVIEPAKSEYRNLLNVIDSMLLFTIGEERAGISSPFRLNPFYFPDGISLQTHIDFLKAVFNASFAMYAPMPYILEDCLYKIYEDKGWNIAASINTRGNSETAYPTLSDLYNKIDDVVESAGYHDRIAMDIKAALKTRINNLCIGAKGLMLNTSASIRFDKIITSPVVFELKALGNDEEKAFMMGLILMSVWEYYESSRSDHSIGSDKLKHLLVIEEAHRLLKNVPVEKVSEEQSNIKGKGIETFCNLLAEIRAYGEGVLVSEQIPVKLAPDVIKNSNLKIMHRLTSKEDRDFMGDTMELNRHQKREAARLGTGEAIFYREGLDRPVKIQVSISTLKKDILMISDQSIQKRMLDCFYKQNPKLLMRFASCQGCKYVGTDMCGKNLKTVKALSETQEWKDMIIKLFIPYIIHPDKVIDIKYLTSLFSIHEPHFYCTVSHIIKDYIDARSNYYQWTFEFTGKLTAAAYNAIRNIQFLNIIGRSCYQQSANDPYRFVVCKEFCKNKALFCYEGSVLLKDPETHNNLVHLLNSQNNNKNFYNQLKQLIIDFVKNYSSPEQHHAVNSLAICYLIQKLNEHQFSLILQREILRAFVEVL